MFSRLIQTNKQNFQIERVKFGVTLDEVCTIYNDIPGPLLILILKLNKEAPYKKDVFRAPGHQSNMKKLIHCLQNGRLVNIDHFTVYTIASVLKKFLRKLPGGIFTTENEDRLFNLIKSNELSLEEKQKHISNLIANLPLVNQHLLVLLFGTFNAIANLAKRLNTGMTSEAIGVSVAPSFFHSCVPIGCKVARMEDVQKFKLATLATQFLIDNFGVFNLFGFENYKYYGRISGRLIKVIDNCIVANKYPYANTLPLDSRIVMSSDVDECQSMPALYGSSCLNSINQNLLKKQTQSIHRDSCASNCEKPFSSLLSQTNQPGMFQLHPHSTSSSFTHYSLNQPQNLSSHQAQDPYNNDDIYGRLSISLENSVFKSNNSPCNVSSSSTTPSNIVSLHGEFNETLSGIFDQRQISLPLHYSTQCSPKIGSSKDQTDKVNESIIEEEIKNLDQLKIVNKYAESTKSLSFLPIVHERQTARMKTRSEWFLNPNEHSGAESDDDVCTSRINPTNYSTQKFSTNSNILSYKEPGVNGTRSKAILRKTSSKEKRIIRRSSSKKDKENGNNCSVLGSSSNMSSTNTPKFGVLNPDMISKDEKILAIGSSYKPRI